MIVEERESFVADKKNSGDDLDLDDILDSISSEDTSSEPEEAPEAEVTEAPEEETEVQRQIREAKEELARESQVAPKVRPTPEAQLSPEEKELRLLQDRVVRKRTAEAEAAEEALEAPTGADKTILIHFIINGFTAQSRVWQRGQEIEFVVGGAAYEQTLDRFGNSWLEIRNNPVAQIERFGAEYFREGPFPGLPLTYTKDLTDPDDIAAMQSLAAAEAKRNRAAPVIA